MNASELHDIILPAAPLPVQSGASDMLWVFILISMAFVAAWLALHALRGVRLAALQRAWRARTYDDRESMFLLADCLRRRFKLTDLNDTPRFYSQRSARRWADLVAELDALRYRNVTITQDQMIALFRQARWLIIQPTRDRRC